MVVGRSFFNLGGVGVKLEKFRGVKGKFHQLGGRKWDEDLVGGVTRVGSDLKGGL